MSLSDFGKQQPAKAPFPVLTKLLVSAMVLLFVYQVCYLGNQLSSGITLLLDTVTTMSEPVMQCMYVNLLCSKVSFTHIDAD